VQPMLEKTLELSRQFAQYFPHVHIADPLIDQFDYGMKAEDVRTVFAQLREALVPLVQAITDQKPPDDSCLHLNYPEDDQLAFGLEVAQHFGYDLKRGRQDLTHHPFAIGLSPGDVRITTRTRPDDVGDALFSTLHEAGHALYEQGVDPALDGTPLNEGTSSGVHESQSRLWENIIGRSRGFWEHYYPQLQAVFRDQLGDVPLDTFYRAINRVQPSLIRVDADEVTYNLHVMIRFDLELEMLEGRLAVRDLPEAWRARYKSDLGIEPPDDRDGALQDVHWFMGTIGGCFQGYTLGNIMSLQFYEMALKAHPEIPAQVGEGRFETLHTWLRENIYRHGSKFTASELLERVTGGPLSIEPYMNYLRAKFGELYRL
jgi:carboxypeptidase Taq